MWKDERPVSSLSAESRTPRLVALDGLRGIAAIAVVLGHVLGHMLGHHQASWFYPSYLAVDFFFVLSGFVLARTYEARFTGGLSFAAYMGRRLIRLYPAILAGLVLGLAVALAQGANGNVWIAAALQAMMLPRLAGPVFPLNDVQWSLFFELLANAIHALIHRWLTTIVLTLLIIASAIALWALSIWHADMSGGFAFDTFDLGIARVMFSFFAGVAIHRLTAQPLPRAPSLSFLAAAVILTAVLAVPTHQLLPRVYGDLLVTTLLWPALVYLVVLAPQPIRLRAFADWSGRLSYPLYAVHFPIVTLAAPLLSSTGTPITERLLLAAVVLAACFVVAMLVERYVERPVLSRKGSVRPAIATS